MAWQIARIFKETARAKPHLRRPGGKRAKLGLHLACDVVQQVLIVILVQQLLARHLPPHGFKPMQPWQGTPCTLKAEHAITDTGCQLWTSRSEDV